MEKNKEEEETHKVKFILRDKIKNRRCTHTLCMTELKTNEFVTWKCIVF